MEEILVYNPTNSQATTMTSLIKKPSAWIPIAIPLAFDAYIAIQVASATGIVHEQDEGVGAHLFQLWLLAEPFMVGYFAFKWLPLERRQASTILAAQILAALLLLAIVHSLKL
jgi:hypothetical protein